MSRKWERMVAKNSKIANKQREKTGKKPLSVDNDAKFKGRSWMLPVLLILIDLFYVITFMPSASSTIFWVTAASYVLLALMFWWRRPYLKINRKELELRKWSALKHATAEEISRIILQDGYVIVELKKNKSRWVLSRLLQRYDTGKMSIKLREFAKANAVPVHDETAVQQQSRGGSKPEDQTGSGE